MRRRFFNLFISLILILILIFCGCEAQKVNEIIKENETHEDGLYIDGTGPIPGTVLIRSTNRLSTEESDLIFQEYNDEVDKLLETAGQLEDMLGSSGESMSEIQEDYIIERDAARQAREEHDMQVTN